MGESTAERLVERDYSKKPLTAEEIETIFGKDDVSQFLNTRHAVYKERGFAEKFPSREELIELITAEPNLIRRPVTRAGKRFVVGFDRKELAALVNS